LFGIQVHHSLPREGEEIFEINVFGFKVNKVFLGFSPHKEEKLLDGGFLAVGKEHLLRPEALLRCYLDGQTADSRSLPGTIIQVLVLSRAYALGGLEVAGPVGLFGRAQRFHEADG
jgi:hypothetical protein